MRRTMATMCIYPRYFSFIFLVLLMLASIFVDFSLQYEVPHLEEATFRVYQSRFLRLKRKLFVSWPVCLWTKHGYLCYSLPVKKFCGRRGGLMVSALDSGANSPGSSPGRGHCVVFLGKTLNSHSASLHPGV